MPEDHSDPRSQPRNSSQIIPLFAWAFALTLVVYAATLGWRRIGPASPQAASAQVVAQGNLELEEMGESVEALPVISLADSGRILYRRAEVRTIIPNRASQEVQ